MRIATNVHVSLRVGVLSLIACLLLGPTAVAQTIYGSVSGTVVDQTGGVIPGAEISVRNLDTGLTRETIADDKGFFRVPSLPPGNYAVQASAPGFQTVIQQPVTVSVAVESSVPIMVKPATVQEVITVTGEAPIIETTKSQLSKTVDERRILELPGRNTLTGLALLQPGTTPNNNGRPGSGFTVNGGRSRSNNFTIDGANNNDQSLSIPRQLIPPEAIQEFSLITNNFSAEHGRNSGSVVNVITRSGTNDLHGNVMWTWQGNGLDALTTAQERTFKAQRATGLSDKQALRRARGVTVDNLGGVAVGGPVKRDHTFFFTSYDRQWFRTTAVPSPTIAISQQGLANLQAASSQFAPGALQFLTATFPTANDPTARGQINVSTPTGTVSVPLQQFNRALTGSFPYGRDFWRWMQKVDTRIGSSDTFSFRYLINDFTDPGSPTAIPGQEIGQVSRDQSMTINHVRIFGPNTVNEFRFTYSRRAIQFPEKLGATFTITGFNSVGNSNMPQYRTDNVYEWSDSLSRNMGRNSVKVGVNVLRYQLNSFFAPNTRGTIRYPSLADFLFDRNADFSQYAGNAYVPSRTTEIGAFLQNDFRWKKNLTLNLGVRYEYTSAPFGYFSNAEPDINNWAPRFGFAWTPEVDGGILEKLLGRGRSVIRGGYAISYDQVFQNILLNNSRNYPRGVQVSNPPVSGQRLYIVGNRPAAPSPEDYVARGGNPLLLPERLYSPNKRISQPYGQQFSLGIERQLYSDYVVKIYYVGSRGVKLVREVERNLGFQASAVNANPSVYAGILPSLQPIRNAAGTITSYRMDPTRGSILIGDGLAQSVYHSMQLTLEKRFSRNLQFQANYTWSAFINDSDDILGGQANGTLPSNPLDLRLDRGRSGFDQPHRFVANYIYNLPDLMRDNAWVSRILGGWQLSGITTLASGTPFTVLNSLNALGILPGQISTVTDSQRPTVNASGTYPQATSSGVTNPYYVLNPLNSGIVGTAGRNIERTGGTVNFDMSLSKRVRTFSEGRSVQFRWEVFNVFMHRNFTTIPLNTVSANTDLVRFLNLGQTNVGGRNMLFTLRYTF